MWQQAQAEELMLVVAENATGYFGVYHRPGKPKPYQAEVWRGGKMVYLGIFATAEEAALCVARSPEGQAAAAERVAAAPPLTSEDARQQAQAEKLTLLVAANNNAGFFGVHLNNPGKPKPYQARVRRGGKKVSLGNFATAEEAALCVARTPEGRAAARRAAAEEGQGALPAVPPGVSLKKEGTIPPMPTGAFVKEEGVLVPLMPPDAFVKVEVVVKEEEGSDSRPKRQRAK